MGAAEQGNEVLGNNESQVEFGPEKILMNLEFLQAVRSGKTSDAREILNSEEGIRIGEARIPIGPSLQTRDDKVQDRTSILRGVTIGGNTSLHIVASYGHLDLVEKICSQERSLLLARNQMRETPLHCAARAGHDQIVSHIISTAGDEEGGVGMKTTMLRATKRGGKTALHEAAQNGHTNAARVLLSHDRGLAYIVDDDGVSPLYMAVVSGSLALVQEFKRYCPSEAESTYYAGPNGQTALHAAVLCSTSYLAKTLTRQLRALLFPTILIECFSGYAYEIAQELLQWDQNLEKKADDLGAIPLHYAASTGNNQIAKLLLKYDASLAYIPDSSGSYPIHVSASMGRTEIIDELILKCPDSDELLDAQGRNFFHVAAESRKWSIVSYFIKKRELSRLMDASDFKGNTPLHLVVENGDIFTRALLDQRKGVESFFLKNWNGVESFILKNWKEVESIVSSKRAEFLGTPDWLHKYWIQRGGLPSPFSFHLFRDDHDQVAREESVKLESLLISSVLTATVTFAAAFTMPGGYKDDGTPILAKRFAFKAFVVTDALAFLFSVLATLWLAFATVGTKLYPHQKGTPTKPNSLYQNLVLLASKSMIVAAVLMIITFALAVYIVLTPVHSIAVAVCVLASVVAIYTPVGLWLFFKSEDDYQVNSSYF